MIVLLILVHLIVLVAWSSQALPLFPVSAGAAPLYCQEPAPLTLLSLLDCCCLGAFWKQRLTPGMILVINQSLIDFRFKCLRLRLLFQVSRSKNFRSPPSLTTQTRFESVFSTKALLKPLRSQRQCVLNCAGVLDRGRCLDTRLNLFRLYTTKPPPTTRQRCLSKSFWIRRWLRL